MKPIRTEKGVGSFTLSNYMDEHADERKNKNKLKSKIVRKTIFEAD